MQLALPLEAEPKLPVMRERLLAIYGPQRDALRHDPTAQFFKALISSRTLDRLSEAGFQRLCVHLGSWERLPDIDPTEIAQVINCVRHEDRKAQQLVAAARIIKTYQGRVDLAFLADWSTGDAFHWLDRLPGAGPKVSAATLNFSTLRKPTFVIDTHLLRVFKRIGLLPLNADFVRGHHEIGALVPIHWDADDLYELHWLIKMHGQITCRHHFPNCRNCVLMSLCAHFRAASTRKTTHNDRRVGIHANLSRSFPRKRESSSFLGPRFRGDERERAKAPWTGH